MYYLKIERGVHFKPNIMKLQIFILFIFGLSFTVKGQNPIIYDLDSYQRVNFDYRLTTFSPDLSFSYSKTLNTLGQEKFLTFRLGGLYLDYQLINSETNQKSYLSRIDLNARAGTLKSFDLGYDYNYDNRSYSGLTYFKNGFEVSSRTNYMKNFNSLKEFEQELTLSYDIGFGFGRIEVVNNAWLGARILQELDKNGLLTKVPEADEMTDLFDIIGDLQFERVMDPRLMTINRLEKMIEFIEEKELIEEGSIPAFVTIYDAFRFEDFFFRQSGERLEFTLSPAVNGTYFWNDINLTGRNSNIRPGFEGSIDYEVHRNGDVEYYSKKSIGATLGYFEHFRENEESHSTIVTGDIEFNYTYRYLPSLRTNLEFATTVVGSLVKDDDDFSSILNATSKLSYFYYFSPATQLSISLNVQYSDTEFQIDEYQPSIGSSFLIDVVHAIR